VQFETYGLLFMVLGVLSIFSFFLVPIVGFVPQHYRRNKDPANHA
jgi:hypothetical protein